MWCDEGGRVGESNVDELGISGGYAEVLYVLHAIWSANYML